MLEVNSSAQLHFNFLTSVFAACDKLGFSQTHNPLLQHNLLHKSSDWFQISTSFSKEFTVIKELQDLMYSFLCFFIFCKLEERLSLCQEGLFYMSYVFPLHVDVVWLNLWNCFSLSCTDIQCSVYLTCMEVWYRSIKLSVQNFLDLHEFVNTFDTILPLLLKPFIYKLRNKKVKS